MSNKNTLCNRVMTKVSKSGWIDLEKKKALVIRKADFLSQHRHRQCKKGCSGVIQFV
jgi:hypothetical protein